MENSRALLDGRAEGLGEGEGQLIEGAEVRKEVGDVAGDVGIGAEGEGTGRPAQGK